MPGRPVVLRRTFAKSSLKVGPVPVPVSRRTVETYIAAVSACLSPVEASVNVANAVVHSEGGCLVPVHQIASVDAGAVLMSTSIPVVGAAA
jgi:hypothetical protein